MPKSIVAPLSSQIPMLTFRLKNASNVVMKKSSDFDLDPHIEVPVFTTLTFSLTQNRFLHGIARVQRVLVQLDAALMLQLQYGF